MMVLPHGLSNEQSFVLLMASSSVRDNDDEIHVVALGRTAAWI
jgi:hypothetical protein